VSIFVNFKELIHIVKNKIVEIAAFAPESVLNETELMRCAGPAVFRRQTQYKASRAIIALLIETDSTRAGTKPHG
jgi:hypothetical protein